MQLFTPLQYLKIDVASNFGLDKEDWDTRLDWFDANEAQFQPLLDAIQNKRSIKGTLMEQAKEPAMFFAGLTAWQQALRGESISYPISLDATASGAQLLAILVGCEKSAAHCNVIDAGHRNDLYTNGYKFMLELLGDTAKISRDDVKEAIMPSFFGSKARPKEIFGVDTPLHSAFTEVMEEKFTGIWALNKSLLALWQPDAFEHAWELPDGFHVKVMVMAPVSETVVFLNKPYEVVSQVNMPMEEGRSISANVIHSIDGMVVREMERRCSYDPERMLQLLELLTAGKPLYEPLRARADDVLVKRLWNHYLKTGFLSARILELLDEENLFLVDQEVIKAMIATLPTKPFPVLSVHD